MNKFRVMLAVVIGLIGLVLTALPVQAAASDDESTAFGFQIVRYADDINQPCPKGSISSFMLTVRATSDGQIIDDDTYNKGVLVRQGGRQMIASVEPVLPAETKAELNWFTGRRAKLNVDTSSDYVQFRATGPNMTFKVGKLRRDCIEDLRSTG